MIKEIIGIIVALLSILALIGFIAWIEYSDSRPITRDLFDKQKEARDE